MPAIRRLDAKKPHASAYLHVVFLMVAHLL